MASSLARFLVTGAKGFIGAWVVKNLVERGESPWVFDVDAESHRLHALLSGEQLARIKFVLGDVSRLEDVEGAVTEHGITHLVHLAGMQMPACAADPIAGARVNVIGTLNVFESARRRADHLKHIVYASSAAVFGPDEAYGGGTLGEDAVMLPGTHYGVFKQCNEGNARIYFLNNKISSIGLRPWAVYGVGRDFGLTSGPTKAIKATVAGRPFRIGFTGQLDLQYADDTAKIFLRCAEADLTGARAYSMRGAVVDIEEFLEALARVAPDSRQLIRAEGPHLPIAHDLDDGPLVRDIKDLPRTPLEEGIRQTVEIFTHLQRQGQLDLTDLGN